MLTPSRLLLVALLMSGCGASERPTAPLAETRPTYRLAFGPVTPELFLTVMDDRADAAELRATTARSFEQMDAIFAAEAPSCIPPFDPAAHHPVDRTVLVVHPSANGPERYTSELDSPALGWRDNQRTQAAHDEWARAVTQGLEPKVPASDRFAALAAYEQALSLVRGMREPDSDDESAIVATLPPSHRTTLFVGLGRDDESAGDAAAYAVPPGYDTVTGFVILPRAAALPEHPDCYSHDVVSTARYQSWIEAQGLSYAVGHWPCEDDTFVSPLSGDCGENCLSFSPLRGTDGAAACTVLATLWDDAPCPAEYGWLDPETPGGERTPRVTRDAQGERRVCEIRQLAGEALQSCVTSLECPDCEPGWCATDVLELVGPCSGEHPNRFRFVKGADYAARASVEVTCEP